MKIGKSPLGVLVLDSCLLQITAKPLNTRNTPKKRVAWIIESGKVQTAIKALAVDKPSNIEPL